MRPLPLILFLLCAPATVQAAAPLHYLTLVNRAHSTAIRVEVSRTGEEHFRPLPLAAPLQGGGGETTLALRDLGCEVDLRLTFRDGRSVRYSATPVCRGDRLQIRPLPSR